MKQNRRRNAFQNNNQEEDEEEDEVHNNGGEEDEEEEEQGLSLEKGNIYLKYTKTKLSKKCVKLESCGEGGFGSVEAFYDHTLGRVIAAKKFNKYAVYLQEKRRLIRLKQEQLEFVNDMIGFCDQERTLMFELGEATLLEVDDTFQENGQSWKESELAYVGWSLLRGLRHLRKMKSYHSDISPNNAMFFMEKVKFIDLGSSEINNNQSYLKQFKLEFVNHQIKAQGKRKKQFTDQQITQNEMYALGKTLLYLALIDIDDKSKFIMSIKKKSQKDLIQEQIDSLKQLEKLEWLKLMYPKVRKAILALMYPFQVNLEDEEEEEEGEKQDQKIKGILEQLHKQKEIKLEQNRNNSNVQSIEIPLTKPKKAPQNQDDNEEDEIEQEERYDIKQGEGNSLSGSVNDKRKGQDINYLEPLLIKKRVPVELNQSNTQIEKTMIMETIIVTEELHSQQEIDQQNYDVVDEEDKQIEQTNSSLMKLIDQIIDLFEQVLQSELTEEGKQEENKASLISREKRIGIQHSDNYGTVIERSDQIRSAIAAIQQSRISELLSSHDDPSRELVFLSTSTAAEWRREIATQMISDALNAAGNLRQQNNSGNSNQNTEISKHQLQRMIHEKILKIQQRILKKKHYIEDSFIDAIQQLYALCKDNKEYHSLIECHFALFLIYRFLGTKQQADEYLQSALKKLQQQFHANKYKDSLTLRKVEQMNLGDDVCWELTEGDVNDQIEELNNNQYTIIY